MAVKHPRPRPIHELLNPEFGVAPDVTLLVLNGAGEVEGELKAHGNILALSRSVLKVSKVECWKVGGGKGCHLEDHKVDAGLHLLEAI